jgi:hypothetical protein
MGQSRSGRCSAVTVRALDVEIGIGMSFYWRCWYIHIRRQQAVGSRQQTAGSRDKTCGRVEDLLQCMYMRGCVRVCFYVGN